MKFVKGQEIEIGDGITAEVEDIDYEGDSLIFITLENDEAEFYGGKITLATSEFEHISFTEEITEDGHRQKLVIEK